MVVWHWVLPTPSCTNTWWSADSTSCCSSTDDYQDSETNVELESPDQGVALLGIRSLLPSSSNPTIAPGLVTSEFNFPANQFVFIDELHLLTCCLSPLRLWSA